MFWRPRLVSDGHAEWISETSLWFAESLGEGWRVRSKVLILPTRAFFDAPAKRDHGTALAIFNRVKELMHIADWPCELEAHDPAPDHRISDSLTVKSGQRTSALATFRRGADGQAIVSYDPAMLQTPRLFISTMAHELSHYVLANLTIDDSPGGRDLAEHTTDLFTIASGFGLFKLDTAVVAEGYTSAFGQGWRIGRQGYISAEDAAFAMAFYLVSAKADAKIAMPHLDRRHARLLAKGLRQISRSPELSMAAGQA